MKNWILPIFFSLLFIFFIVNSFNYGNTIDEHLYQNYSNMLIKYYGSGFQDDSFREYYNLKYFGGFFNLLVGLVQKGLSIFGVDAPFKIRHAITGIFAFLLILGFFKFLCLLGSRNLALLGIPAILLFPRLYGHSYNNSSDIPFAAMFCWSMFFITKTIILRRVNYPTVIALGFFTGSCIAIRFGGAIVFLYMLFAFGISILSSKGKLLQKLKNFFIDYYKYILLMLLVSYIVVFSTWPLMHEYPLSAIQVAAKYFVNYHANDPQLFRGEILRFHDFPWYFIIYNILITSPIYLLLLAILGTGYIALTPLLSRLKKLDVLNSFQKQIAYFTLLWFFFPIAFIIVKKSTVYDVVRHVLFTFPGLISLFLISIYVLIKFLSPYKTPLLIFIGSIFIYFSVMLFNYISLNPYQYLHYNSFVGGLKGASAGYKLDYWGHSIKELVEELKNKLPKGKFYKFQIHNIISSMAEVHFNDYMFLTSLENYDCIITISEVNTMAAFKKSHPHLKEFVAVKRQDVTLSQALCKDHVFSQ